MTTKCFLLGFAALLLIVSSPIARARIGDTERGLVQGGRKGVRPHISTFPSPARATAENLLAATTARLHAA